MANKLLAGVAIGVCLGLWRGTAPRRRRHDPPPKSPAKYPDGYCYLKCYKLESQDELERQLKSDPYVVNLVEVPTGHWARCYWKVEVRDGPNGRYLHISDEEGPERTWTLLRAFAKSNPELRVGRKEDEEENPTQDPGLDYLMLFKKEHKETVSGAIGRYAMCQDAHRQPKSYRANVMGVVKRYRSDPTHVYLTTGPSYSVPLWDALESSRRESGKARLVAYSARSHCWFQTLDYLSSSWRLFRQYWLFILSILFVGKVMYDSTAARWWLLASALMPIVSYVLAPLLAPTSSLFLAHLVTGSISTPVEVAANTVVLFLRGDYSTLVLYLNSQWLPSMRTLIGFIRAGGQVKRALAFCRQIIVMIIYYILEFFLSHSDNPATRNSNSEPEVKPRGRQPQGAFRGEGVDMDKWVKQILLLLAAVLRACAVSVSRKGQPVLNKLAEAVTTAAHATTIPRAIGDAWGILGGFMGAKEPEVDTNIDMSVFDITNGSDSASTTTAATTSSTDGPACTPSKPCWHPLTKDNIQDAGTIIEECPHPGVHIIEAATGTGKSTAIPHTISQSSGMPVAVTLPTIAGVQSSAMVIEGRFGVTPHIHADSKYRPGSGSDTHLWTSKALMMKTIFDPSWLLKTPHKALQIDEKHHDNEDYYALEKLSPRFAEQLKVLWTSATFSSGSAASKQDTPFPVDEVIDDTIQPDLVFTDKCKPLELRPTGVNGRYLVFCASVNETQMIAQRATKLGFPAHAISSKNFQTAGRAMMKDLYDVAKPVVIVAATNALEVSVTYPFNWEVEFGSKLISKMNFDPPSLSLKRISVTESEHKQRMGRLGRVMKGTVFSPKIDFSKPGKIQASGLAMAKVYGRLFGFTVPEAREMPFLDDKVLTDSFLKNLMATRMHPIAVAAMTTPSGEMYSSFKEFTFPAGAHTHDIVWSSRLIPESHLKNWFCYETKEWEIEMNNGQIEKGSHVRAPFWDYTSPDDVQIDNWKKKLVVGEDEDKPEDDQKMVTTARDTLARSWLFLGRGRQPQGAKRPDNVFSETMELHDDEEEEGEEIEEDDDGDDDKPEEIPWWKAKSSSARSTVRKNFNGLKSRGRDVASPAWEYVKTLTDKGWGPLLLVFGALMLLWLMYWFHQCYRRKAIVGLDESKEDEARRQNSHHDHGHRVAERAVVGSVQLADDEFNAKRRPFEAGKRLNGKSWYEVSDEIRDLDGLAEDLAVTGFKTEKDKAKIRAEIETEFERWLGEGPSSSWADEVESEEYFRNNGFLGRSLESALAVKSPKYSLSEVKASTAAICAEGDTEGLGRGVILNGMLVANKHVLKDAMESTGKITVYTTGVQGRTFKPTIAGSWRDLVAVQLPLQFPLPSSSLTARKPVAGELVTLVRFNPVSIHGQKENKGLLESATPSETSVLAPDSDPAKVGYTINSTEGDCGTAVIALSDGALVALHAEGGEPHEQANFGMAIHDELLDVLRPGRKPQSAKRRNKVQPSGTTLSKKAFHLQSLDPANMIPEPRLPAADELMKASRVARDEQARHPILPLESREDSYRQVSTTGSIIELARLTKFTSMKSRIRIDQFANEHLSQPGFWDFDSKTDYLRARLETEPYWRDFLKYDRLDHKMPSDFHAISLPVMEKLWPSLFEPLDLLSADEVKWCMDPKKSSGPRLAGLKGAYINHLDQTEFRKLIRDCEELYHVPHQDFVSNVWHVSPKDEIRDRERVLIGKTRTFIASPLETLLGTCRIFRPFNDRFVAEHLKLPSTVGINKFEGGWNRLAQFLCGGHNHKDMLFSSGDGSRFDSSVNRGLMSLNCYVRARSLPDDKHFARNLKHLINGYTELVYTNIVCKDHIIRRKSTGNPSGSPNTTEDNTVALIAVAVWAFVKIFGQDEFIRLYEAGMIRFVCNGDDFAYAMHHSLRHFMDEGRLAALFLECGLVYEFTPPTDDIRNLRFLSQQFHLTKFDGQDFFLPKADVQRIWASALYTRDPNAIKTHSRYVAALIHCYPHPRAFANMYKLVLAHERHAMADRPFVASTYASQFILPTPEQIAELYYGKKVGFRSKIKTHKQQTAFSKLLGRIKQSALPMQAPETTPHVSISENRIMDTQSSQQHGRNEIPHGFFDVVQDALDTQKESIADKHASSTRANNSSGGEASREMDATPITRIGLADPDAFQRFLAFQEHQEPMASPSKSEAVPVAPQCEQEHADDEDDGDSGIWMAHSKAEHDGGVPISTGSDENQVPTKEPGDHPETDHVGAADNLYGFSIPWPFRLWAVNRQPDDDDERDDASDDTNVNDGADDWPPIFQRVILRSGVLPGRPTDNTVQRALANSLCLSCLFSQGITLRTMYGDDTPVASHTQQHDEEQVQTAEENKESVPQAGAASEDPDKDHIPLLVRTDSGLVGTLENSLENQEDLDEDETPDDNDCICAPDEECDPACISCSKDGCYVDSEDDKTERDSDDEFFDQEDSDSDEDEIFEDVHIPILARADSPDPFAPVEGTEPFPKFQPSVELMEEGGVAKEEQVSMATPGEGLDENSVVDVTPATMGEIKQQDDESKPEPMEAKPSDETLFAMPALPAKRKFEAISIGHGNEDKERILSSVDLTKPIERAGTLMPCSQMNDTWAQSQEDDWSSAEPCLVPFSQRDGSLDHTS